VGGSGSVLGTSRPFAGQPEREATGRDCQTPLRHFASETPSEGAPPQ
jgi:hypothetical protein